MYPIKVTKTKTAELLNYEPREGMCSPGCALGEQLKVPVYKFLKEALIRKYGEDFYQALDQIAQDYFFGSEEQIKTYSMQASIADIRKDYKLKSLSKKDVMGNAIDQFDKWWNEAIVSELDEVNAMTLATASADGVPGARTVLLKGFDKKGFVFFTNYESYKGKQLQENPRATLVLFWKELQRQVIITGVVEKNKRQGKR